MVKKIVLPRGGISALQQARGYEALKVSIHDLSPDDALFVTTEAIVPGSAETLSEVRVFIRRLRVRLRGTVLTYIEDAARGGVWVYRNPLRAPGNGRAVGAAKEDEVRSRPLEG